MFSWLKRRNKKIIEGHLVAIDHPDRDEKQVQALIFCFEEDIISHKNRWHYPLDARRYWFHGDLFKCAKLLADKMRRNCSFRELNMIIMESPPYIRMWVAKDSTYIYDYEILSLEKLNLDQYSFTKPKDT